MPAAGPDKERCGAQRPGQPPGVTCKRVAGAGTPHLGTGRCSRHLGNSPNHKTAAEREQARQACALFGLEMTDRDPAAVLMDEITRTRRSIVWHETEIALVLAEGGGEGRVARLVERWAWERRHLGDVSAKAITTGVARRTLEMQEDIARQVAAVLARQAELLGHDPSSPIAREASRVALQLVAGT